MGYETGTDWRVHVGDGATPTEAFAQIGGEMSFEWQRSSTNIDYSSKDDADYANQGFGRQAITINVSGKVKLPDTGLERAFTVSKTGERTATVKIMKGTTVKFQGKMAFGNFSSSFPDNAPATYSVSLSNRGAPTTDTLGA